MNPLIARIQQKIREAGGRITFASFMEEVLYHPLFGYYNRDSITIGEGGDFYTAPMVHPIFGQCVARQILEIWEQMGCPTKFTVIEMGAGNGTLARDMLQEWRKDESFSEALTYIIVEQSPVLQKQQKQQLKETKASLDWYWKLSEIPQYGKLTGVIVSNELFDALPVHRLMMENGELVERYVTWMEDAFKEVSGPISDERFAEILDIRMLEQLLEGDRLDVSLRTGEVLREMANLLSRGCIITFDYGDEQPDVYLKYVSKGGIRCYFHQKLQYNPFEKIGEQDITADVDFTYLMRTGEEVGLQTAGITTQTNFWQGSDS
ncbi:SAM-dependent methyltransferase [Collibacillus ludicampi]|uniref:SAM-dependent methyltransferase n=1 Tax=Collibacillus ludicampi TaxID=2771369 RepID=A0AAV4LAM3_9BACL|nr:SAM-dependent methyltransferase [Collibacillus ludicampi]GIM44806.1 SAM-dependent methyltransferase [Collibacillus ludicampi]